MKAQTQRTLETRTVGIPGQVTPVIIKLVEGGPEQSPDSNVVTIESDFMPFEDSTGGTWQEAFSTFTGQIHELTIKDGQLEPVYCKVLPQADALVSMEITYDTAKGEESFYVSEVKKEDGLIHLRVKSSSIPFQVTEKDRGNKWNKSEAAFSNKAVKAVFSQRRIGAEEDSLTFEY